MSEEKPTTVKKIEPMVLVGGIVALVAPVFALAPALIVLAMIPVDGGASGMVLPWFMLFTLPLGAIGSIVGIVATLIGATRSFVKARKGIDGTGKNPDFEKISRLLLLVLAPLVSWVWPILGFVYRNMLDVGVGREIVTVLVPAVQLALTVAGLYLYYFKVKTTRGRIVIPLITLVSLLYTTLVTLLLLSIEL